MKDIINDTRKAVRKNFTYLFNYLWDKDRKLKRIIVWCLIAVGITFLMFAVLMIKYSIVSDESLDRACREIISDSESVKGFPFNNLKCEKSGTVYEIKKYDHIPANIRTERGL